MKNQAEIKKRLTSLYSQKQLIDNEIISLENLLVEKKSFSKEEKIELFKNLFIARDDIFLKKWINKDKNKEGFSPLTQTFKGSDYLPFSNSYIEEHLRGTAHLATLTISKTNKSKFLVLQILQKDMNAIINIYKKYNLPAYFELNSKNDLYLWFFYEEEILAKNSKALGIKLIKEANISAKVYPNQDFVNSSNLGGFIELPLQLKYRNENKSVFVGENKENISDQWIFLNNINKIPVNQIKEILKTEDENEYFNERILKQIEFPSFKLYLKIYDFLYIPTFNLSKSLLNALKDLASFDNPQIKTLLALRKPIFNIARQIKSFEEDDKYLKLPRGLVYKVQELFISNKVSYEVEDKKYFKDEEFPSIVYTLKPEQNDAIKQIKKSDFSICVAPPGYGKTLIASKMIEIRKCSTLVLVNKNMLLDQWIDRFVNYFEISKKDIGFLGKSKNTLNTKLDIATMQSLKNSPDIIKNYSFVIVDECHHIPALTFEQIIKLFCGKYILGLSATPKRKDGLEEILYQQVGEISYEYKKKRTLTHKLKLVNTTFVSQENTYAALINDLCKDEKRNKLIIKEITENRNRKILVLTDRIEHIRNLELLLNEANIEYLSVHGSLSKKVQKENMLKVESSSLVLATSSFFGEGIDFPHLNTIIFASPISYYGRLVQYLGRIGRDGQKCLAIDLLDSKNAMLYSSYKKRQEGYKQMHYSAR